MAGRPLCLTYVRTEGFEASRPLYSRRPFNSSVQYSTIAAESRKMGNRLGERGTILSSCVRWGSPQFFARQLDLILLFDSLGSSRSGFKIFLIDLAGNDKDLGTRSL
jgi:hypothetical protein